MAGIYAWVNNITKDVYIGSAKDLNKRLLHYTQPSYLKAKKNTTIVRAIKKYGYKAFTVYILEFCNVDKKTILELEQKYIDLFSPAYNQTLKADSSQGYIHTLENKQLMREKSIGRVHLEEIKTMMARSRKKENNSFFGKTHSLESKQKIREKALKRIDPRGFSVILLNINTKELLNFHSIRKAAVFLVCSPLKLKRHQNKVIDHKFLVSIVPLTNSFVTIRNINNKKMNTFSSLTKAAKFLESDPKRLKKYIGKVMDNKYLISKIQNALLIIKYLLCI